MGLDTGRQCRVTMRHLDKFTKISLAALCVALSSCTMPSSGPSANKIQAEAKEQFAPYTLINVTPNVVAALDQNLDQQLAASLGNSKKRSSALIGVGDTVAISIWEASPDGLFSSGAGRGGGTQIPEQPVSGSRDDQCSICRHHPSGKQDAGASQGIGRAGSRSHGCSATGPR